MTDDGLQSAAVAAAAVADGNSVDTSRDVDSAPALDLDSPSSLNVSHDDVSDDVSAAAGSDRRPRHRADDATAAAGGVAAAVGGVSGGRLAAVGGDSE